MMVRAVYGREPVACPYAEPLPALEPPPLFSIRAPSLMRNSASFFVAYDNAKEHRPVLVSFDELRSWQKAGDSVPKRSDTVGLH